MLQEKGDRRELSLNVLWPDYGKEGYFDSEGDLKSKYVCKKQVEPLVENMARSSPALTRHQIRRFFQHARAIEAKLRAHTSTWGAQKTVFKKLAVAAADAFGKKDRKIPELFYDFINANTDKVKNEKDFLKGFMPHFEALVGFGARHLKEKETM